MLALLAVIGLGAAGSDASSLYVANFDGGSISIVSPDSGTVISTLTTPVCIPFGLACDNANNLYVGNQGNGTVTKVATDGSSYSILASNLVDGRAITFDNNSNLYVLGFDTGDISQVTPAGNVTQVASAGMRGAAALAWDVGSGNFYVMVNHQAVQGAASGELLKIATNGSVSTLVDFSSYARPLPQAMTIDTNGNLYVTATSATQATNAVVYEVTPQGNVSTNALLPDPLTQIFVSQIPFALCFDPTGRLHAYDWFNNTIYRVAANGALTAVASGPSDGAGTFSLAFDSNGRLYMLDRSAREILKSESPYTSSSVFIKGWLEDPSAVAFDNSGNLFVANFYWGTIFERTPAGGISLFAALGTAQPAALAFDTNGNLYAANQGFGFNSISKIAPNGSITTNFAHTAGYPGGLAFDASGNLYTAVHGGTIAKITTNGSVSTFASGLNIPVGIVFGTNASLYVADLGANAVYRVNTNGAVSNFVAGLDGPQAMAVDANGDFYVGCFGLFDDNSVVLKITPQGSVATLVNTNGGLFNPYGLAFGPSPLPAPPVIQSVQRAAGNFGFSFLSVSNQSYTVQGSLDLTATNWFDCTNFLGNGLVMTVSVPASNGVLREFFRIKLP